MVENIDIDSVEGFCLKDRTVSVRLFVEDAGAGEDAIIPLEPLEFTNPEALIMVTSYLSNELDKMKKKRRSERSESEDEDDDDSSSSSADDEEDIIDQLEQWIHDIENHIQFIQLSFNYCQPISIEDDGTIDEKLFGFCCSICKCGPEKKKKDRSKRFFCTQLTKGQKWHRHCCHGYAQRALSPTCLFMYKKFPGISTLVDPKKNNKAKQQQHTSQKSTRKYLSHAQKKLREERSKRRVTRMCNDDFDARKLFQSLSVINFCQASR